jgi:hypothetical protein
MVESGQQGKFIFISCSPVLGGAILPLTDKMPIQGLSIVIVSVSACANGAMYRRLVTGDCAAISCRSVCGLSERERTPSCGSQREYFSWSMRALMFSGTVYKRADIEAVGGGRVMRDPAESKVAYASVSCKGLWTNIKAVVLVEFAREKMLQANEGCCILRC